MPGASQVTADPVTRGRPSSAQDAGAGELAEDGDDFMAALLIRMWSLASGRTLRSDVRPEELSREELIRFWADDLTPPSGRHADPGAGLARAAR